MSVQEEGFKGGGWVVERGKSEARKGRVEEEEEEEEEGQGHPSLLLHHH